MAANNEEGDSGGPVAIPFGARMEALAEKASLKVEKLAWEARQKELDQVTGRPRISKRSSLLQRTAEDREVKQQFLLFDFFVELASK